MAITQSNRGWKSALTNWEYASLEEAQRAEDMHKRIHAPESEGQKKINAMSTQELREVAEALHTQIVEHNAQGNASEQENIDWLNAHPHIHRVGTEEGYQNKVAIRMWLEARGHKFPFSSINLSLAANELTEKGTLLIDYKLAPKQEAVEDKYVSPLDSWRDHQRRF